MTNHTSGPPLFEVRQLSKRYRTGGLWTPVYTHALFEASFVVDRREIVALVGESGSGKSTVARACVRLEEPSGGQILLEGRDVLQDEPRRASRAYRKRVQMVFQDPFGSLNPMRTIGEILERPLTLHHGSLGREDLRVRIVGLLDAVGLSPGASFLDKRPGELSGGQRQRVAIARALAPEPDLIFADEPVSMLDLSIRAGILNLMLELKASRGLSFVYITHDLASARYIADRTMVMYAGRIVEFGPSDELLERPLHPYTKLLVAAVPDMDREQLTTLPVRSSAPNHTQRAEGCAFAPRCPNTLDSCTQTKAPEVFVEAKRFVRCHLLKDPTKSPLTAKDEKEP